jgi:hypothetical protein
MTVFSEDIFKKRFNFIILDRTVASTIRLAAQDPKKLYLFFQRYSHFNGYASAVIARLASSIGLSRYLFNNSELVVEEEADRGMEIAAHVLSAAADEGANDTPVHRALAQLTLKTVGNYANLSADDRNSIAQIPDWLTPLVKDVVSGYEGTPGNVKALVKAMGFHLASEMLGDREYALIDEVIRYENRGIGFDRYLREVAKPVKIHGHSYTPWSWILIHSRHDGTGVEIEHSEYALTALNLAVRYRTEPEQQLMMWAIEGFEHFVNLQQQLFQEIARECLDQTQTVNTQLVCV